jgi:hypothetical protein
MVQDRVTSDSDIASFILRGVMDVHDLDRLSGVPIK